jgi:thiosulfate dehydrogenase [quinone] large subunit
VATATDTRAPAELHVVSTRADKIWGTTRIGIGLIFLWAFFDKLLGLGFATGRMEDGTIDFFGEAAWINGGSPTYGFLNFGTTGPFAEFFQGFAGSAWADWLFMIGLLGIGLALTFGFAVRLGAYFGAVLLMLMYVAAMPPEHHPFLDDHVIYAIVLLGLAEVNAGDTFGVGRKWSKAPIVERYPILR